MDNHIKVVCFDNIASLCPGLDENKKQDWDAINQWFLKLRGSGITVIVVHHTNKSGDQRGTSARIDNVDARWDLIKPRNWEASMGASFTLKFSKYRQKPNYLLKNADYRFSEDAHGFVQTSDDEKIQSGIILYYLTKQMSEREIVKVLLETYEVKMSQRTVNRKKRDFIKNEWMSEAGELTEKGQKWVDYIEKEYIIAFEEAKN